MKIKKTLIIAEAGVNHNGDMEKAFSLIELAKSCNVDCIKFQTFKADRLVTSRAVTCNYQNKALGGLTSQMKMLKKLELSEDQFVQLYDYCTKKNIEFMSTPFDRDDLNFLLNRTGIKRIKIPSGEMLNPFLLLDSARANLPIILSTGMSDIDEITIALGIIAYGMLNKNGTPSKIEALKVIQSKEGKQIIKKNVSILHCTSEYPVKLSDVNLRAMNTIKNEFKTNVGLSDHSEGVIISIAAVALGASIIEKHFTLDKNLSGPDHKSSLSPSQLNELVLGIRKIELALGSDFKQTTNGELINKNLIRGSLVASQDISAGEQFNSNNLTSKRPGDGLNPIEFLNLNGKKAKVNYKFNEQIT